MTRSLHQRLEQPSDPEQDGRWVLCRRPRMMVGGELTIEMLDLQFNSSTRFYSGPVQMKANNGILIIDDFGRQRVSPEELLNRWVVPLDRRIDFLTLAGGKKIEIPFDMLRRLCHQPRSRQAGGRGVPAPHPDEDQGGLRRPPNSSAKSSGGSA